MEDELQQIAAIAAISTQLRQNDQLPQIKQFAATCPALAAIGPGRPAVV
jgi:hypothetical protein